MIVSMLRVIVGFVVACLVAGLAIVLFVYTPLELVTEHGGDRASEAGLLALAAATHTAVFAAPFALIAAAFAEWQRIGSWLYYALVGVYGPWVYCEKVAVSSGNVYDADLRPL